MATKKQLSPMETLQETVKLVNTSHVVHFLISEKGNQRVEIKDTSTGEIVDFIEAGSPSSTSNFDEIATALNHKLSQQNPNQ